VLTRVTVIAVSSSLIEAEARQISSIVLPGSTEKTPVVGSVKVRAVPNWSSLAAGVAEKTPPEVGEWTCIQQDALWIPPMVAWALAAKKPWEAGVIAATTTWPPDVSSGPEKA
jgi:hypothetical protein